MTSAKRRGVLLLDFKDLKQTLMKIHNFKKINVISVETLDDDIVLILEWNKFESVKLKKKQYPPAYTKKFFSSKGLKL